MNRFIILLFLLVAGGTAQAEDPRPLWSYHNGNTLIGHNADYQNGFIIGVIDGYLAAHQRLTNSPEEAPGWLDDCITAGWPAPRLAERLRADFGRAYRDFKKPAAQVMLALLQNLCNKPPR